MNALLSIAAIVVLMASVNLWIRAILRLLHRQPLLPAEPRMDLPWGLADIFVAIFLQLLTAQLAREWLQAANDGQPTESLENLAPAQQGYVLLYAAIANLAAWGLTVAWLVVRHRPSLREFGVDWRRFGSDLRLGAAAFAMLAPIVYGLQYLLAHFVKSEHPLIELLKKESSGEFFAISGFAAVLVAPLVEESIFRVLLQGWLERVVSKIKEAPAILLGGRVEARQAERVVGEPNEPAAQSPLQPSSQDGFDRVRGRMAIFGSAALFALAHFRHGPDPIPLFVFAIGLGYLYQMTQRIVASIVVHMLLNASTLAMLWVVTQHLPPGE